MRDLRDFIITGVLAVTFLAATISAMTTQTPSLFLTAFLVLTPALALGMTVVSLPAPSRVAAPRCRQ